eukprot:FR738197.1.p1 GENE.FR738197.1~~FR738197.1.p1  ORF type:complete len:137 (+),score=21.39 FR738197.1:2-412(+)
MANMVTTVILDAVGAFGVSRRPPTVLRIAGLCVALMGALGSEVIRNPKPTLPMQTMADMELDDVFDFTDLDDEADAMDELDDVDMDMDMDMDMDEIGSGSREGLGLESSFDMEMTSSSTSRSSPLPTKTALWPQVD